MKKLVLTAIFFCYFFITFAQPGDPGGGQDPDVPIGGIEILIGIGGVLGGRKLFKKRIKTL